MKDSLTLRQGLANFHAEYKDHLSHDKKGISSEAQAFFISHDIAHVLFGCDITLFGEGSVKIWTIFGTSLGFWNHIKAYQTANAFALSKNFSLTDVTNNLFKFLSSIPALIMRANQMHKRWPWSGFDSYLDTPIYKIRKEFNIQVLA